jgi:ABC-type multidrug transport system fused ATPase/permease subunit
MPLNISARFNFGKRVRAIFRAAKYVYKAALVPTMIRDFLFIAITAMDLYMIKLGGQLIDSIITVLEWDVFVLKEFFYTDAFRQLAWLLVLWIVSRSFNTMRDYFTQVVKRAYWLKADQDILKKLENVNQQEVENPDFQELMSFVPNYAYDRLWETYLKFSQVMKHSLTLITSVIILYSSIGWSVLLLVLFGVAEPLFRYFGEVKIKNYRLKETEGIKYMDYLWRQAFHIPNFSELKVDGVMKYFRKTYRKGQKDFYKGSLELEKHYQIDTAFWAMVGQILMRCYQVFILVYSVANKLSVGSFKAMFDYTANAYNASFNVWRSLTLAIDYGSYAEKFFEFLDYPGFGDVSTGEEIIPKGTPELKFLNLDFIYPDDVGKKDKKIIENVNLTIKPGEKVAFVGGDGSGKSTIVKTLCGLYEIKSGDYMIGENSIRELDRGQLKGRISVIYQDFIRYSMTLRQNIVLAADQKTLNKSRYEHAKEAARVTDFMKTEGLSDKQMLGKQFKGGRQISPGYWQRIAIARMLYRNRDINIMDEPFTYIDGISRSKIIDGIFEFLGEKRTLIYITRDTDMLKKFDKIYYFVGGKVKEEGPYNELVKKKGAFYKELVKNR